MDERQWFEEVYRQHVDLLFRVGRRLQSPGSGDDALDDIIQEVFLALWDRRAELMNHPNVGGWLMEALKFRVSNARSKLTRRALRHAYSLDDEDALPVADVGESPEQRAALARQIDALTDLLGEENARLFLAHVLEGRTAHELAVQQGVSDSCMGMRIYRLRKQLARHPEVFFSLLLLALRWRHLSI